MKDIINKLKKYEIRIRKNVTTQAQGNYHSIFKGSGIEFSDVRAYQYGDDVRTIDWNVSAKGHGTFVKTFKEEKEQNVFFVLDVSASQDIGSVRQKKIDIGKEICAILSLSAIKESGNVGLICFSDKKELYVKPNRGIKHGYDIIYSIFKLKPQSIKTDLNKGLRFTMNLLKKKSIIVIISDFIDENFDRNLIALSQKHDVVIIHLSDKRELDFPPMGIIPLYDKESKKTIWVNSSSKKFRTYIHNHFQAKKNELQSICRKYNINYLWIDTQEEYVSKLVQLFKTRNKSQG